MTEAELAGEKVKELAQCEPAAVVAARGTPLPGLPKHFLMRDGPRDGSDREREHEQGDQLIAQAHTRPVSGSTPRSSCECRPPCCDCAAALHSGDDPGFPCGARRRPTPSWTAAAPARSC